jgi:archaellum component FlaC
LKFRVYQEQSDMSTDRLTEVLNYLSAMSREVGEMRSEVRANGQSLEALRGEMRTGFEEVRTDIRRLKHRLEIVTEDLMELRTEGRDLRKRMEELERKQA